MRLSRIAPTVLLSATVAVGLPRATDAQNLAFSVFERYLESLRQQAGIPGLSAAVVQQRRIVWESGFGFQDLENSIAARPDTPYPIGDLTQTFSAVLLLQCVERGLLDLDSPVQRWAPLISEPGATVRLVLAHASDEDPRGRFKYDPARYATLTAVIDGCGDRPYRQALADEILDRLAMIDSVPGHDLGEATSAARELFEDLALDRYAAVLTRLAVPYKVDRRGRPARSEYPSKSIDAATGLVSTVRDLARYDATLDEEVLLLPETLDLAWTNTALGGGAPSPFGLGWFVQTYNGQKIVWHFGLSPDSFSSLIVKVPGRGVTLILLANSDGLSAPFPLADGDVTSSLFARMFLRLFI